MPSYQSEARLGAALTLYYPAGLPRRKIMALCARCDAATEIHSVVIDDIRQRGETTVLPALSYTRSGAT